MMMDINNRVNVVGDGINVAQRVMDFSRSNQIVVSRAYYDVISQISDNSASHFSYLGARTDKHQRNHELYVVLDRAAQSPDRVAPLDMDFEPTRLATAVEAITPEVALDIETALARIIGPLAHVLVKKALPRATDAQSLRDALAVSIPDAIARDAFVRAQTLSRPLSVPMANSTTTSRSGLISRGTISSSTTTRATEPQSESMKILAVNAEQQAALERALSKYLGPLSKTLVRREVARQISFSTLLQALAAHIDKPEERARFLSVVNKL
jgi:hypothetical protein